MCPSGMMEQEVAEYCTSECQVYLRKVISEPGHWTGEQGCPCLRELPSPVGLAFGCYVYPGRWEELTVAEDYQRCSTPPPMPPFTP